MIDYSATYTDQYQLTMAQVYFHKDQKHDAGLDYVKIAASNQLDEEVIKSLIEQQAPIDLFGVGTSLVTGRPDAALDGVFKLSFARNKPRLKLSETPEKINLPGKKQVYRILGDNDQFYGADVVCLAEENENDIEIMLHPSKYHKSLSIDQFKKETLLHKVVERGERLSEPRSVEDITKYSRRRLNRLPEGYKRFQNPHLYKIELSTSLKQERDRLFEHYQQKA